MAVKAPENFAQIFPEHPHRRFHILISILAFVLVAGSIIVYQISKTQRGQNGGEQRDTTVLTDAYKAQMVKDLKEQATPPLSDAEKTRIVAELKKRLGEQ